MEVLHLLWFPSVPHVEEEGEEQAQMKRVEAKEEEPVEDGNCSEDDGKANRRRKGAWERENDMNKVVEKQGKKKKEQEMWQQTSVWDVAEGGEKKKKENRMITQG